MDQENKNDTIKANWAIIYINPSLKYYTSMVDTNITQEDLHILNHH